MEPSVSTMACPRRRRTAITVTLTSTIPPQRFLPTTDKTGSSSYRRCRTCACNHFHCNYALLSRFYYVASVMVGDVDAMRQPALLSDSSPPLRTALKAGGKLSGKRGQRRERKLLLAPQTLRPRRHCAVVPMWLRWPFLN